MSEKATAPVGDKQIIIETGKIAKQADGAVTVQLGETIVIVAAVGAAKAKAGQEFFPLTVDYREKAAAAGKFPGGYFKREGRPTEKEILTSRLIDRPIRPLFPKGWYNEVQVQTIVLSADGENDPDMIALVGASAALMVSDIPWAGPLGAVRVGRIKGQFVANPTHAQMLESDLDLVYVGSETDLVMYEGSAKEITEADFNAALKFGQDAIQPTIAAQKDLAARVGKAKRQIKLNVVPDEILKEAKALAGDRIVTALLTSGKMDRESAVSSLTDEIGKKLVEKFGAEKVTEFVLKDAFYYIQKEAVRGLIMKQDKRLDGRDLNTVRAIHSEVGVLPRAHGSALFQRGETQALTLCTLGTGEDAQEFDSYTGGASEKKFILHYNFPNFSVGETGRISGPGRREIGHGALAERSLEPMVPTETYPYSIRITSEIMESNGSTSMATVCGGSLALMDAGVPMKSPVAGISVGLCTEHDDQDKITSYKLMTDIIGWEDAFCDMDCKLAGTDKGITGFQLDLKLRGIPLEMIMAEAVEKARVARLHILAEMAKTLGAPRKEISKYAPRIETIKINPEKIGALIGPGGKNIKKLVEESGCEINIEDDGTVNIYSVSEEGMKIARDAIAGMTAEAEIGKIYRGRVVTIKDFGAFVEFLPGKDGLVHISELANFRVKQTEDIVKMGDEIWVKCLGVDEKGRVRLSRRAAMAERDQQMGGGQPGEAAPAGDQVPHESQDEQRGEHRSERGEYRGERSGGDRGPQDRRPRGGDRGGRGGDRGYRGDRGGEHRSGDRGGREGGGNRGPGGGNRPEGGASRSDGGATRSEGGGAARTEGGANRGEVLAESGAKADRSLPRVNGIFDLTGKVALVTGTSRGLGQYLARALARAGADLVITSRNPDTLKPFQQELESLGRKALPLELDVRDYESIQSMASAAVTHYGKIDILVNNAGCNVRKPALDVSWKDWNLVLDSNLRGTFFVAQAIARHMIPKRCGRIINIGSVTCVAGYAGLGPYGASRGGVKQLTMSLADDWGVHGITVNCLAPGWFKTAQNAVMYENQEWVDYLCDRIPLKRPGQPQDLDGAVVFLASDASAYITGQTLLVDGGISTGATRALPVKRS